MSHRLFTLLPFAVMAAILALYIATNLYRASLLDFTSPCWLGDYEDVRCMGVRVEACKVTHGWNTDWCIREVGR